MNKDRPLSSAIEQARRATALGMVLTGWLGGLALGAWAVFEFDPAKGHFAPQWVGLGYIFLVGVAIAGSAARSRMRMTDTIVGAFKSGQEIADRRWEAMLGTLAAEEARQEIEQRRENGR